MVDKNGASFLYKKRGVYYFSKQVPCDIKAHYSRQRVVICLKTKSKGAAERLTKSLLQRLEDYWLSLRLSRMALPAEHLILKNGELGANSNAPKLSEALETYLRLKSEGRDHVFVRGATRNIKTVIKYLGDKPIDRYSSSEAATVRDKELKRGISVASIKRNFSTVRSVINLSISEHGINCVNPFSRTFMPETEKGKRHPIPLETIKSIREECLKENDEMRWIILLLAETGMRLGEVVGLLKKDIILEESIPHINLRPYPWRSLKTLGSARQIPLISNLPNLLKTMLQYRSDSAYLFPRYNKTDVSNANSASAALNKWLKPMLPENCVVHSFRHSFRDRLRSVECPSDIIDAIGGWKTFGVGQGYGSGYGLDVKYKWMNIIALDNPILQSQ